MATTNNDHDGYFGEEFLHSSSCGDDNNVLYSFLRNGILCGGGVCEGVSSSVIIDDDPNKNDSDYNDYCNINNNLGGHSQQPNSLVIEGITTTKDHDLFVTSTTSQKSIPLDENKYQYEGDDGIIMARIPRSVPSFCRNIDNDELSLKWSYSWDEDDEYY